MSELTRDELLTIISLINERENGENVCYCSICCLHCHDGVCPDCGTDYNSDFEIKVDFNPYALGV